MIWTRQSSFEFLKALAEADTLARTGNWSDKSVNPMWLERDMRGLGASLVSFGETILKRNPIPPDLLEMAKRQ